MKNLVYTPKTLCTRCGLAENRTNQVLARGRLPCDVLMIGEAPGKTEDFLGKPFCGPAGRVLDLLLRTVEEDLDKDLEGLYCITNVVQCYPHDVNGTREPTREEADACLPNLKKIINKANAKTTVLMGKVANKYARKHVRNPVHIYHPAYLLRKGADSYEFLRTVQVLKEVFE